MQTGTALKVLVGFTVAAMATLVEAQEHKGQQDIKKAVGAAKVTLAQAIDLAQKEVAGGKVIEAGLEAEKDATIYEVLVLSGEAVKEVEVDAASGKVLGVKDEKPDPDEENELAEAKPAIAAAKVTFAQALETAAKEVKDGKAFKIELEMKDGKPTYDVALLQGDKVMKAALNAADGTVLKVEERPAKHEKEEGEEHESKGQHREHPGHMKAVLAAAKVTFVQALETAGKEVPGAQVLEITLGGTAEKPVYDVELLKDDQELKVTIDAVGGKLLKQDKATLDKEEADELAESKAALGTVKISFAQALEFAAKEVKDGQVLKAELELEKGGVTYEVVLLQSEKAKKVTLDVVTGKVLKVEEQQGKHQKKE